MRSLTDFLLAVGVLAAILLIGVGVGQLLRGTAERTRAWLMLLAGIVVLVNIWLYASLPVPVQ